MNLYVWEGKGVLTDYSNGMIVAIANSLDEAILVIEKADGIATYQHEGAERVFNFRNTPSKVIPLDSIEPQAFTCWGGA